MRDHRFKEDIIIIGSKTSHCSIKTLQTETAKTLHKNQESNHETAVSFL